MNLQNPQAKQALIQRLRRIEGQLRGIQGMIEEERDCQQILQQLSAARAAVQSANTAFLEQYVSGCLLAEDSPRTREELARELAGLIGKA